MKTFHLPPNIIHQIKKIYQYPRFLLFEESINKETWKIQPEVLQWAENVNVQENVFLKKRDATSDRIYDEYVVLFNKAKKKFYQKESNTELRILIHLPDIIHSPGGFSLFNNLAQAIDFLGVKVEFFKFNDDIESILEKFKPNIFLSSDHQSYLSKINWDAVNTYRNSNLLKIGLTASLEEYGNTPLKDRFDWAKRNKIDFFYSFRAEEYLLNRREYIPFYENNYDIFSVEFGANPLLYHPNPDMKKDLNYVFLASQNSEKWERYSQYLTKIFNKYPGLIDGPGWPRIKKWLPPNLHKFVYARAKVGINLHIPISINFQSELNERTYILAASGVPQLIDNPMLLEKRFNKKSFFIANNPKEYFDLFEYISNNSEIAEEKALNAMREVYEKHTTFHRAEKLINHLQPLIQN